MEDAHWKADPSYDIMRIASELFGKYATRDTLCGQVSFPASMMHIDTKINENHRIRTYYTDKASMEAIARMIMRESSQTAKCYVKGFYSFLGVDIPIGNKRISCESIGYYRLKKLIF